MTFRLREIFGQKHKKSQWLFQTLLKKNEIDDEKLSITFQEEFPKSSFVALKHYLQNYILESLRSMKGTDVSLELTKSIVECRILFNKSPYNNCEKLLKSLLKQAYYYEEFLIILELLKIKRDLVIERIPESMKKDIEDITRERSKILELYKNQITFNEIYDEFFSLISLYNKNPSPKVMGHILKTIKNPLLENISNAKSFRSKLFYFDVMVDIPGKLTT